MQALECGLPVVTVEGRFLRTRFASGLLRTMGIDELVAATADEYVQIVERLLVDEEFMRTTRLKIVERFPMLLDDVAPVRSLECFLERVVKDKRGQVA